MSSQVWVWVVFNLFVLAMLALDLGVFHRRSHQVGVKEALVWSGVWITLALLFNLGVYYWRGPDAALEFLTGYLIEKALSVDNLFVFLLIFSYFRTPARHQHRALFWGVLGALIMRAIFIFAGISLIERFHWIIYIFGALLILTGVRIATEKDKEIRPERNLALKIFRRLMPVTDDYHEGKFFIKQAGQARDGGQSGRYFATPLFIVLLMIETTDVIFAVDSIPAILAITRDPFIVYTSNVFAILGMRALYFALAGVMRLFHHLHYGLSVILVFVGAKMLIADFYKIPVGVALSVVAGILIISIITSMAFPRKEADASGGL